MPLEELPASQSPTGTVDKRDFAKLVFITRA